MIARIACVAALAALLAAGPARADTPVPATPTANPAPPAPPAPVAAPDALALDGVPPIRQELADRIFPYTEARGASLADWHPARRELLIATRFGNTTQIHDVRMPLGARRQLTFDPEPIGRALWRPVRGDGFVFSKDAGGSEFFQLYWRDAATGRATRFTDGGRSRNTLGPFSNDGKRLAYESTRRNGKDTDIYLVDPADPATERRLLELEGGGWSALEWSPDDRQLLVRNYRSVNDSELWIADVTKGEKRLLTPQGKDKVAWGRACFVRPQPGDKSPLALFVTTDLSGEFQRLSRLSVATGEVAPFGPDHPHDVTALEPSDDGRRLAYVTNEAGIDRLHLLDLADHGAKPLPVPELPRGTLGGLKFRPGTHELGLSLAGARSTADVYSLDVDAGKLERWTESETGGLDPRTFAEAEPISWKSFDGREITGLLHRPDPARFPGPRPVLVNIHGGPESQSRAGFIGRLNFLPSELGVAIIFPNVRGSAGFGKTFLKLDNAALREDSVKDIGALLDWIAAQSFLDKARVAVRGGSYGGYMSLACMEHFPERLRCGVDEVGIANFVTFLERTEAYRRDLRRVEYGDERDPAMRETLARISPVGNVGKIKHPMLILQGRNDPRVPWTEAEQMVAALKSAKVPVWYLLASDEGHGFAKKRNADFGFLALVRFLETHLLT